MMAFGINRAELNEWKRRVSSGDIAFLTHYWEDKRFPQATSVTKVGSCDVDKLIKWGEQYGLKAEWVHYTKYPHFDLFVPNQKYILQAEELIEHLIRFRIK